MQKKSPLEIFMRAFPPQIIIQMIVIIALLNGFLLVNSVLLGRELDRMWDSSPLWVLILLVFSALIGLFITYRVAVVTARRARRAYLQWVEAEKRAEAPAESAASVTTDAA